MNEHTSTDSAKMKKNLNHTQNLMRGCVCECECACCARISVSAVSIVCILFVLYMILVFMWCDALSGTALVCSPR